MRNFLYAVGGIWFLLITAACWRGFSSAGAAGPRILIQPQALPGPGPASRPDFTAPASSPPRDPPGRDREPPAALPAGPEEGFAPAPVPAALPAAPFERRSPAPAKRPRPAIPAGEGHRDDRPIAGEEAPAVDLSLGRCLLCGGTAESWVEIEGQRIGYCRRHSSRPQTGPAAAGGGPKPTPAAGGPAAPAQCEGATRTGARCRRKTSDPSGFCYQHRPGK